MLNFNIDLTVPPRHPVDSLLISVEAMALQFMNHNQAKPSVRTEVDALIQEAEYLYTEERFEYPHVAMGISFEEALNILTPIAPNQPEAVATLGAAIWNKAQENAAAMGRL